MPERERALDLAGRALARRDFSERGLRDRLARAGIEPAAAEEALAALGRAGLVDDRRFAFQRAQALAERGKGNAAIRFDLEQQGISSELADEAVSGLEPELARAERVVARRGPGPKTARLLAQRGFDHEVVERAAGPGIAQGR